MRYLILIVSLSAWLAMGILSYGAVLGYYQRAFPEFAQALCRMDRAHAFPTLFLGPVGLAAMLTHDAPWYGYAWRCISAEEAAQFRQAARGTMPAAW